MSLIDNMQNIDDQDSKKKHKIRTATLVKEEGYIGMYCSLCHRLHDICDPSNRCNYCGAVFVVDDNEIKRKKVNEMEDLTNQRIMTLEDAIQHAEKKGCDLNNKKDINCALNHMQLATWLKDYKNLMEQESTRKKEQAAKQRKNSSTGYLEQLKQLLKATWDGDLICKSHRDELVKANLAEKTNGYNFITSEGINVLIKLGMLHP